MAPSIEHLRLRSLGLLLALEQAGSLHRAAAVLHTTQPALSAMLNELERVLGARLFERSRRGLAITDAGRYALAQARMTRADLARLQQELAAGARGEMLLRVGVLPLLMHEVVPAALARLHVEAPALRIRFDEGAVPYLLQVLRDGGFDLVLGRVTPEFAGDELDLQPLLTERLQVLAASGHRLGKVRRIGWPVLAAADWILPPPDTLTRRVVAEAFIRRGLAPPTPRYESASFHSSVNIVAGTDCLLPAPSSVARHYATYRPVRILPLRFGEPAAAIAVIRRRGRALSEGAGRFIAAVRAAARAA